MVGDIFCIGTNYMSHSLQQCRFTYPMFHFDVLVRFCADKYPGELTRLSNVTTFTGVASHY